MTELQVLVAPVKFNLLSLGRLLGKSWEVEFSPNFNLRPKGFDLRTKWVSNCGSVFSLALGCVASASALSLKKSDGSKPCSRKCAEFSDPCGDGWPSREQAPGGEQQLGRARVEDQRETAHGGVPWPHRDEDHGGLRGEHHRYDGDGHGWGSAKRKQGKQQGGGKRAAKPKEVITVPEEAANKGHRGDREDHRGGQEDHRGGTECPGDDRGDGGRQKSQEGCLGGSSLGQGGRGGKEEEGSREESGPRRPVIKKKPANPR